jgi:(2Fe-2S) ferredoxin
LNDPAMSRTQKLSFQLVGQFEGYELSRRGKIRYLCLTTNLGSQRVKLTHESCIDLLRGVLSMSISQGSWLEVTGAQKINRKGHRKGLRAEHLQLAKWSTELPKLNCNVPKPSCSFTDEIASPPSNKAKILVCQKSACRKRGSGHLQQMIEQMIDERGLSQHLCVKAVGCLKGCSKGPNVVINKTSYRDVSFKDVVKLLDQHFAPQPQPIATFYPSDPVSRTRLAEAS